MAPLPRLAPRLAHEKTRSNVKEIGQTNATTAPTTSFVKGLLYSLLYLLFSTAVILSNKHIITETNFSCPIAVSSLGSFFGWAVSVLAISCNVTKLKTHLTLQQWCVYVLPIGVCTALSLAFANMAYFYLALSFIQMVKAFAPVVTFVVLVSFKLDRFDVNVVLAITVIVAGCFTASYGQTEAKSAQLGLACMLICEVAEAFRSAGMQYLLATKSFSLFDGMYYFSPATLLFLCVLVYLFEWEQLKDPEHLAAISENPFAFLAASCLGFFVNLASLAVIQNAGSLTLKIVSQLKNVVVIVAAVVLYDDVVSTLELAGYVVAICGFAMYQDAKKNAYEFDAIEKVESMTLSETSGFLKGRNHGGLTENNGREEALYAAHLGKGSNILGRTKPAVATGGRGGKSASGAEFELS